jgi:hypothetical protein
MQIATRTAPKVGRSPRPLPGIERAPTPWLGVIERTMLGAFLLWMVVLAVALWPTRPDVPEG